MTNKGLKTVAFMENTRQGCENARFHVLRYIKKYVIKVFAFWVGYTIIGLLIVCGP